MNRQCVFGKALAIAVVSWLGLTALTTSAQSPNDVILEAMTLIDQELSGRKEELSKDKEALYDLIDSILLPRFDKNAAGRFALGKKARTASPEQLNAFIDAFYRNLLGRYADGILEFDSSRIEVLPFSGDDSKKSVMVKTKVKLDDGEIAPVDYRLVKREDGWKIIDVVIEGISYLTSFRSELESELRQKSLDEVILRLNTENASDKIDE